MTNETSFFEKMTAALTKAAPYIALAAGVICLAAVILLVVLILKQDRLRARMDYFMKGSRREPLEDTLHRIVDDNVKIKQQIKSGGAELSRLRAEMQTTYRKTGVVKYNAFPGMAGKMSSSVALLNNENNGIVITSIHGQDGCYTYIKEIMNGKSVNPLTKEDEEALKIAVEMQV